MSYAPFGAWCFLTPSRHFRLAFKINGLNAPYGASVRFRRTRSRYMWTSGGSGSHNAPYQLGAFSLTCAGDKRVRRAGGGVLMHLMALGAFNAGITGQGHNLQNCPNNALWRSVAF